MASSSWRNSVLRRVAGGFRMGPGRRTRAVPGSMYFHKSDIALAFLMFGLNGWVVKRLMAHKNTMKELDLELSAAQADRDALSAANENAIQRIRGDYFEMRSFFEQSGSGESSPNDIDSGTGEGFEPAKALDGWISDCFVDSRKSDLADEDKTNPT
ncbi:hypothetical protein FVE85_5342 [Porphyridium purpureum]|uniref:Uncharacterized protein n=1 Tax=Porphyridium purpureum TaxID=35688 RepID=A0A5J4Z571_PORPP|nr:hypothetical protein FVE85_5342 [Porphyridium purpureum]|eukprot:POR3388..scf295_1